MRSNNELEHERVRGQILGITRTGRKKVLPRRVGSQTPKICLWCTRPVHPSSWSGWTRKGSVPEAHARGCNGPLSHRDLPRGCSGGSGRRPSMNDATSSGRVTLELRNSSWAPRTVVLEPWTGEYTLPPCETVEIVAEGDLACPLEIETVGERIIVYAFDSEGATLHKFNRTARNSPDQSRLFLGVPPVPHPVGNAGERAGWARSVIGSSGSDLSPGLHPPQVG